MRVAVPCMHLALPVRRCRRTRGTIRPAAAPVEGQEGRHFCRWPPAPPSLSHGFDLRGFVPGQTMDPLDLQYGVVVRSPPEANPANQTGYRPKKNMGRLWAHEVSEKLPSLFMSKGMVAGRDASNPVEARDTLWQGQPGATEQTTAPPRQVRQSTRRARLLILHKSCGSPPTAERCVWWPLAASQWHSGRASQVRQPWCSASHPSRVIPRHPKRPTGPSSCGHGLSDARVCHSTLTVDGPPLPPLSLPILPFAW